MMNAIVPDRLFPSRAWFVRRLKLYGSVAVASACVFLFVAGWMADPRGNHISALISPISAIVGGLAVFWLSRPSEGEKHHRPRL
jgi:ATP/ADP translocase